MMQNCCELELSLLFVKVACYMCLGTYDLHAGWELFFNDAVRIADLCIFLRFIDRLVGPAGFLTLPLI